MGEGELTAGNIADMFFDNVVSRFGVPASVLHDRDPHFTSAFWKPLWARLGARVRLDTSASNVSTKKAAVHAVERSNLAVKAVEKAGGQQITYYNCRCSPADFPMGSKVLLSSHHLCKVYSLKP